MLLPPLHPSQPAQRQAETGSEFRLGYTPELDGLRGIAILMVLIYHTGLPFLPGGFIGVDVFFVLSGFLITSLLVNEYNRNGQINLKHFYLRRALRLLPALLLLLCVVSLSCVLLLDFATAQSHLTDSLIALFYVSNWARALEIHPPDFLGHTWSLSIEEQFYILWPFAFWFLARRGTSRTILLLFPVLAALFSWGLRTFWVSEGVKFERLYYGLDTRGDGLWIGCALGVALSSGWVSSPAKTRIVSWLKHAAPLALFALFAIGIQASWKSASMYYWLFLVVNLSTVVLIVDVCLSRSSRLKRILASPILVWLGQLSYGIYLWHYPIFKCLRLQGFGMLSVLALGLVLTIAIASASYYWLERPILALKNRFAPAGTALRANAAC